MKKMNKKERYAFLVNEHDKEGERLYGKRRWESANFGWGQAEMSICSKVYPVRKGQTLYYLTSYLLMDGSVEHEEQRSEN